MAKVTWVGKAQAVPQVDAPTVSSATVGQTRYMQVDNQRVSYVVVTGDTTTTVAAALVAAWANVQAGQWKELTVVQDTTTPAQINVTGPADGAPFTLTVSSGMSTSTVTTATGPHHADNVLNYSSGALPVTTVDELIFERGATFEGPKYALTALAAIVLTKVTRLPTFLGVIGLPPVSRGGYYEYRARYLQLNCLDIRLAQMSGSDVSNQLNIQQMHASAAAVVLNGDGASSADVLDIIGLASTSSMVITGASVLVAGLVGQVCAVPTIKSTGGIVRVGAGATLGSIVFDATTARISASFTTLTMDRGSTVAVDQAAACSTADPDVGVYNDGGTLSWESTGALPVIELGTDGILDLARCPGAAIGTIRMNSNSVLNDVANRLAVPYVVTFVRCAPNEVRIITGTSRKATLDAA